MTLPWKIVFVLLLLSVGFLLFRDLTADRVIRPSDVSSVSNSVSSVASLCASNPPSPPISKNAHFGVLTDGRKANAPFMPSDTNSVAAFPTNQYLRGDLVYHVCGSLKWVTFDGSRFMVGYPSEYGRVILLDRYMVVCIDEEKNTTYLLPFENETDAARAPSPRFTSSGDGHARGSRYSVHTSTGAGMK